MHLNYFTYKQQDLACSKCMWRGDGKDLSIEGVSAEHFIIDLACPACGEHVGFVQAPLSDELERWKQAHPDWSDD